MSSDRTDWRRRALLAGGAVAVFGWVRGAPHLSSLGKTEFEFTAIPGLEPFRRLGGAGPATLGGALLVGLDTSVEQTEQDLRQQQMVRSDPCFALYGDVRAGPVPVAMFSDFACPVCATMNERLSALQIETPDRFRIVRHELPLLGGSSVTASKAVLAAERQGGYLDMHARLMRTPAVTDLGFVRQIATSLGLDPDRLMQDMQSNEIDQALHQTRALAEVFGFYGTPAFAVGRTVFLGSVSKSMLRDLIAEETNGPCQTA